MAKLSLASLAVQILSICGAVAFAHRRSSLQGAAAHDAGSTDGSAHEDQHSSISTTELPISALHAQVDGLWNHAGHARWLVHAADYAVISTQSTMEEGWPFSHVVSISDGARGNSTGRIIMYVATISQFAADVAADARVSLGVSQAQADGGRGCQYVDAEWPLCARVNVFGHVAVVPKAGQAEAAALMFARHPQMRAFFAHQWAFYEIHLTSARVIDFFGGFHKVTAQQWFAAAPDEPLAAAL